MDDFQEALAVLLGKDAPNLSPSVIARLRDEWQADYTRWQRRDLSARRYVYIWAGVYLQARIEPQAECMLVLIGATPEGRKELLGFQGGVGEKCAKLARAASRPQGPRPDPPHHPHKGRAVTGHRTIDGVQAGDGGPPKRGAA